MAKKKDDLPDLADLAEARLPSTREGADVPAPVFDTPAPAPPNWGVWEGPTGTSLYYDAGAKWLTFDATGHYTPETAQEFEALATYSAHYEAGDYGFARVVRVD